MILQVRKRPKSSSGKHQGCIYTHVKPGVRVVVITHAEYRQIQKLLALLKGKLYERFST